MKTRKQIDARCTTLAAAIDILQKQIDNIELAMLNAGTVNALKHALAVTEAHTGTHDITSIESLMDDIQTSLSAVQEMNAAFSQQSMDTSMFDDDELLKELQSELFPTVPNTIPTDRVSGSNKHPKTARALSISSFQSPSLEQTQI
jgi:hypothetical protein